MLGEEGSLGIEEGRPAVLDNLVEMVGDDLCSKAKTEMIFFNNELYEPSTIAKGVSWSTI